MSALERRLQVLVDDERFAHLTEESQRTGRSIGSIVRAAIDLHVAAQSAAAPRAAAARRLLDHVAVGTEPDWSETKSAVLDDGDRVTG